MTDVMNEYELLGPFSNRNAGFSRWTYAKRKGKTYFLKEFLDPVYPSDESIMEEIRKERILDCKETEEKKKKLYEAINRASDGNLVRIFEYFRYDSHYYIATEKIDSADMKLHEIAECTLEEKIFLCSTIAHSMMQLHKENIIHADMKPDNILIKKNRAGRLIAKIIDFDASFFSNDPPKIEEELGGDQVYLAPEACLFMIGEESTLTEKMDVFALGLIFHQYLTGHLPDFDNCEYDYAFEAALDGASLEPDDTLPDDLKEMIAGMLKAYPEERISMSDVYGVLCGNTYEQMSGLEEEDGPNVDSFFYDAGDL